MHNSIMLALWAIVAFILFKITARIFDQRRHARNATRLGCEEPFHTKSEMGALDPLGLHNIYTMLGADRDYRIPQHIKARADKTNQAAGRQVNTLRMTIAGSPSTITFDPKIIQTVLATQFKDFGLGEVRNNSFSALLGSGIFSSDGPQWEHSRALLRPQFAREQVSDLDLEERHVQNMMRVLPTTEAGWTSVTDIMPLLFRLTLDTASEFLCGESVDSQLSCLPGYVPKRGSMPINERDLAISVDRAQNGISTAVRCGDLYWLSFTKDFKAHCKRCHDFIDHYVNLALTKQKSVTQAKSSGKEKFVFLDALVESTQDPIELRSHLISILIAGRDTTASLMSYVFMVLSDRPDVYAKLRNIILEQFGTYDNPKPITFAGLKSCSYLQWVLNETLRLYPVVPVDGRRALVDTTLPTGGGPDGKSPVYVPKGSQVDYSVYVMHRRKDLWGQDAEEFRPERWNGRKSGWDYLPFNGGPRICIGQQFALTEAGYVVVRMLQRFEEMVGAGNTWDPVEKGGLGWVRHALTLTMCPADGVKVQFKEAKR